MVANVRKRLTSGDISFLADCPSTLNVEDIVFVTGPEVSGIAQVDIVDITGIGTMPAIGIIIEKITSTRARVLTLGEITILSGLSPGKRYFVGPSGQLVPYVPTPSIGEISFAQAMGYALSTNRFIFKPELFPVMQRG